MYVITYNVCICSCCLLESALKTTTKQIQNKKKTEIKTLSASMYYRLRTTERRRKNVTDFSQDLQNIFKE